MDDNREKLWQIFWENGNNATLNRLISAYFEVVASLASEIVPENPQTMLAEFIFAEGIFALRDCIVAYPNDNPTPFEDYCLPVVKKAMMEELENRPNIQPISW